MAKLKKEGLRWKSKGERLKWRKEEGGRKEGGGRGHPMKKQHIAQGFTVSLTNLIDSKL